MNTLIKGQDTEKAAIVTKTARITGYSKRYINMVTTGDRQNQTVMNIYMLFQEGNERLMEKAQQLNRAVKKYA